MTWETKDVLVMLAPLVAIAVAVGTFQAKVSAVMTKLGELGALLKEVQSQLGAEIKELKRDQQVSQRDQGRRLGELETAAKISREIAKMVGAGTPAFGTMLPHLRAASGRDSGQVQRPVDDGSSSNGDDDDHRR